MIWTREQAKALTDRALSFSKAETRPSPSTAAIARTCASRATPPTRPAPARATAWPSPPASARRSGTVTTAEFDDAALQRAMRSAEEIARLSPENPEAMPPLAPQTYRR